MEVCRAVRLLAIVTLASFALGGSCPPTGDDDDFFVRDPVAGLLSSVGDVAVDLRLPDQAIPGTLRVFLSGSEVLLAGQTALPDGVAGTLSNVGEGSHLLRAEVDVPDAEGVRTLKTFRGFEAVDLLNPDECEILNDVECLLPYPSSRFLQDVGAATPTGFQLAIPAAGLPQLIGDPLDPAPFNALDGFSPTVQVLMHFVRQVDLENSGASRLLDPFCCGQVNATPYKDVRTYDGRSLDSDSPSVLLDAETGERIPHFLENDARATTQARRVLFLRPAVSLVPGKRYIVAMRRLEDALGVFIPPEPVFSAYRDQRPSDIPAVEARRAQFEDIFTRLGSAGVERNNLVLAFDFVVQSEHQLTSDLLVMRDAMYDWIDNNALALLLFGFTFDGTFNQAHINNCDGTQLVWKQVRGEVLLPSFITGDIDSLASVPLISRDANGSPVQNGSLPAHFDFLIPCSVFALNTTVHPLVIGHGLFGTGEGTIDGLAQPGGIVDQLGQFDYIAGATDWRGLSQRDFAWLGLNVIGLGNHQLNNFPSFVAKLKQGMVSTLGLARVMQSGLLNNFEEFQKTPGDNQTGVFPGPSTEMYYSGASLGGIMGLLFSSLTPDIERFHIDVGAINFSLLLQRSTQFTQFETQLADVGLDDPMETALGIQLLHELWASAEPAGFARHITGLIEPPFPDEDGMTMTGKKILMTVAWLDKQVTNQASELAARTLGIPSLQGSLQHVLLNIPDVSPGGTGLDSALVIYDVGSFDVFEPAFDSVIPPLANLIPSPVCDPHGRRATIPASQEQLRAFLQPAGKIFNFCSDDGVCNASSDDERPGGVAEPDLCDPLAP